MGKCNNNDYDDDRGFGNDRGFDNDRGFENERCFENERRFENERCNENERRFENERCNDEDRNHVHEYAQSVKYAEEGCDRHNHRVAGVTGRPIFIRNGRDHVHKIEDRVDSLDHLHEVCVTTGPMIRIPGTNKHVHLVCGETTVEDCHCHEFLFTTHIQNPLV